MAINWTIKMTLPITANNIKAYLITADNLCWCEFCNKRINKDERYLKFVKAARRGSARINLCLLCLKTIDGMITKPEIKSMTAEKLIWMTRDD